MHPNGGVPQSEVSMGVWIQWNGMDWNGEMEWWNGGIECYLGNFN